jgi:hypothetical protein
VVAAGRCQRTRHRCPVRFDRSIYDRTLHELDSYYPRMRAEFDLDPRSSHGAWWPSSSGAVGARRCFFRDDSCAREDAALAAAARKRTRSMPSTLSRPTCKVADRRCGFKVVRNPLAADFTEGIKCLKFSCLSQATRELMFR